MKDSRVQATIDSKSVGDPARFWQFDALARTHAALPPAPTRNGRVTALFTRRDGGLRETPDHVSLTVAGGMPGDAWGRRSVQDPDMQLAVMQADVATLIANGQSLGLFGDQLFLSLDLSAGNLPVGSRLRVGSATLEVTPQPHNGCRKFKARFGDDALRFVSEPARRPLNLRGIYLRVVADGRVAIGDAVTVLDADTQRNTG